MDKKVKTICVVSEAVEGGVATHLEHLAQLPLEPDWRIVFVLSPRRNPMQLDRLRRVLMSRHIQLLQVNMCRSPDPVLDGLAYRSLKRHIRRLQPALIHTHSSKAGALTRFCVRSGSIPIIHTPHVFAFQWARGISGWLYGRIERYLSRYTDKYILFSKRQREAALEVLGANVAEKIALLPNGVDIHKFQPVSRQRREYLKKGLGIQPDDFCIGAVVRPVLQKAVPELLKMFRSLQDQEKTSVHLFIAGIPHDNGPVAAKIWAYGLHDRVHLLGWVDEMREFYQTMDLLVMTSHWEGCPYAVLEAMACGCPVLTTRSFATDELLPPQIDRFSVPVGDMGGLANGVSHLIQHPETMDELRGIARDHVENNFSLGRWYEEMHKLYASFLK
ncbi:MAG: glycosyltransferase [Lentisphaerae bacterium]|nr:MAG: glycosyltransferase [Lentisphaerota bacterium]